jgi:hypothetical protein
MAILPGTGSAIAMGKVYVAFTDPAPQVYPLATGTNVRLSATLGANYGNIGYVAGTEIKFSQTFGGKSTPYDYPT